jgi:hypothetical protein
MECLSNDNKNVKGRKGKSVQVRLSRGMFDVRSEKGHCSQSKQILSSFG